ncbi:DUF1793-domain-containing protein [Exidia glandulosa HHB12029]|uniref:DUF1793-domain-containing protein n=1 Tax=Exidia glandulosa HHB12029 TaxID=1314781 RepID=A0A165I5M6_EXIGL|nr:DUF1793-domain-containing protein [Exidia glandulosa HHB12029]
MLLSSLGLLSLLASATRAAPSWTVEPFNPPAIPLAVKHPYLNVWLPQGQGAELNRNWPRLWTGDVRPAVFRYVRVDGKAYSWLGASGNPGFTPATQTAFRFTASRSEFKFTAGPVELTVTFLSPVNTDDLLRQTIPFSYLSVAVASKDGAAHNVQVYNDISAEWVSTDPNADVYWNTTVSSAAISHSVGLRYQAPFEENRDLIRSGTVYLSTPNGDGVTYQTGSDAVVRGLFLSTGALSSTKDTRQPRPVEDQWPVFAHAINLGNITATPANKPVLFCIGHVRDPVVQYIVKGGALTERAPYWRSRFANVDPMISFFLADWVNAMGVAHNLDARVDTEAGKISKDYASLVKLSIRQALATFEVTLGKNADGSVNTNDVLAFMKEISSNGNMNTIDVIFPFWPIVLWTNPTIGKLLLEPHFQYQTSGLYPNKWALHDMGAHYPRANGHNDGNDEAMPVEESGNMLIMMLSYAQKTGDLSQIKQYYSRLQQWTEFLIEDSLIPADQLSTDDFAGRLANQTNLAIKGIVGIKAMGMIAELVGDAESAANYTAIATSYVEQFQTFAIAKDGSHLTLSYGHDDTWGLAYNLFGDRLIGANIFPQSIYDMQNAWYKTKLQKYGIILDTRNTWSKSDWQLWIAAISDDELKHGIVSSLVRFYSDGINSTPMSDLYYVPEGRENAFKARPVVGGHLALLVLP